MESSQACGSGSKFAFHLSLVTVPRGPFPAPRVITPFCTICPPPLHHHDRGLGDIDFKQRQIITCEPDVTSVQLQPETDSFSIQVGMNQCGHSQGSFPGQGLCPERTGPIEINLKKVPMICHRRASGRTGVPFP